MRKKLEATGGWLVLAVFLGGLIWIDTSSRSETSVAPPEEPVCVIESIPYEIVREPAKLRDVGYESVIQDGVRGQKRVCTTSTGEVTSYVTQEAKSQIVRYGTFVPSPEPEYASCPITTCSDGWCSSSTGRGTCSHHGGVAY